ncbi:hypothetical protein TNCV_912751 [Trichonephila clavipes]|nr:hypothetical protein TNCV_912751 [Trichonephila clavipes]
MSDIGPFSGYFLDDKQYHSFAPDQRWRLKIRWQTEPTHLRIVRHAQSLFRSNCDAHDPIAKRAVTVLSGHQCEGHTEQRCLRAYSPPPLKRLANSLREISLSWEAAVLKLDLPPAELWCACSLLS